MLIPILIVWGWYSSVKSAYQKGLAEIQYEIDTIYQQGRTDYSQELNDFIYNSLVNTGELKIKYYSTETEETMEIILVPKKTK